MQKFGDGVSWENHAVEVITQDRKPYHKHDSNSELLQRIKKYKTSGKLIDCGCHVGRWIDYFTEAGFEYTGIDQSQYAVNIAKRLRPKGRFYCMFLWDMVYMEEFDVAVTNAVLQHNTHLEQRRIVPRIYDALKSGGIYYIAESTVLDETPTQRTYENWIKLMEEWGFKFLESWHPNKIGIEDHYLFVK